MRFLGGKKRIAAQLVQAIAPWVSESTVFIEPFIGGASFTLEATKVLRPRVYCAGDAHEDLILLWDALAYRGWIPPERLGLATYNLLKQASPSALRGLAGYGSSFGGKWFGGYSLRRAAGEKTFWGNSVSTSAVKGQAIRDAKIQLFHGDYRTTLGLDAPNVVYYCDPPYAGMTAPGAGDKFSTEEFWDWACSRNGIVFVSEYEAPHGVKCVLEIATRTDMKDANSKCIPRVEKLFATGRGVMQ